MPLRQPSPPIARYAPPGAIACLKDAGPRSVWLVAGPESRHTVKTWPFTASAALKLALGIAQPQRHVRAARRLADAGIPSPRVVAGPRVVRRGEARLLELVLEHVEGRDLLAILRAGDPGEIAAAATATAALLGALVRARLFNRDLKVTNVLLAGSPQVAWLLDPVGVRPMTDLRGQSARMLERLAVEPRELGLAIPRAARLEVLRAAKAAVAAAAP